MSVVDRVFEAHLTVRHLDVSIAFYRDRLGFELAHVLPANQAAFFWVGGRGRTMLAIWSAGASPVYTIGHIAFASDLADVLSAPAALAQAGITALDFDGRPTNEPVVIAWMPAASVYFRDPDGHLLEFIAMLDGEARPDGGIVPWSDWSRMPAR